MNTSTPLLLCGSLRAHAAAAGAWFCAPAPAPRFAGGWTGTSLAPIDHCQRAVRQSCSVGENRQSVSGGAAQARSLRSAGQRFLPWLGVAVLYVGTSMLAAGFLAQRAVQRAYAVVDLASVDPAAAGLTEVHAPVAVWWVPESLSGFMIALALMLLGLGLLAADGDRERSAAYGK